MVLFPSPEVMAHAADALGAILQKWFKSTVLLPLVPPLFAMCFAKIWMLNPVPRPSRISSCLLHLSKMSHLLTRQGLINNTWGLGLPTFCCQSPEKKQYMHCAWTWYLPRSGAAGFPLGCSTVLKCLSHSGISRDFSQLSGFTGPTSTLVDSKGPKGWVPMSWHPTRLTLSLTCAGARTGHAPAYTCHPTPWFPSEENLIIAVPAKSLIWILQKCWRHARACISCSVWRQPEGWGLKSQKGCNQNTKLED